MSHQPGNGEGGSPPAGGPRVAPILASTADAALRPSAELDAAALGRLRTLDPGGRSGLIARVVAAFSTSSERMLPQLRQAAQIGDLAAMRHVVHTFKSSAANVGAMRLSQLCADLESRLRQGIGEKSSEAADEIAAEVVAVDAALRRLPDATT